MANAPIGHIGYITHSHLPIQNTTLSYMKKIDNADFYKTTGVMFSGAEYGFSKRWCNIAQFFRSCFRKIIMVKTDNLFMRNSVVIIPTSCGEFPLINRVAIFIRQPNRKTLPYKRQKEYETKHMGNFYNLPSRTNLFVSHAIYKVVHHT